MIKGKLVKVIDQPLVIQAKATQGPAGADGIDGATGDAGVPGIQGVPGKDGAAGKDATAPDVQQIVTAIYGSKEIQDLIAKEIQKLSPAALGVQGGSGKMDVADLPGYRQASPNQVFGVLPSGKVGFVDLSTLEADLKYSKLVDTDGVYKYIGEALPGSTTAQALWRIKRIEFKDGDDIDILWADSDSNFDNIWDDRLSKTYTT